MRFCVLFLLFSIVAGAAPTPEPLRFGMEVELSLGHLAKMMGVIDFAKLQEEHKKTGRDIGAKIPLTSFDDYLKNAPRALDQLPPHLKADLTYGLNLVSVVQRTGNDTSLTGITNGSLEVKKPQLILDAAKAPTPAAPSGIILPNSPASPKPLAMPVSQERGGLEIPARLDWETLYARWAKLDFHTKASLVDWDLLGPDRKAELLYAVLPPGPFTMALPAKIDASPEVKDLLKKIDFGIDGPGTVEIRHRANVVLNSSAEFLGDVQRLTRLAGVEQKIFNPLSNRQQGVGFHYHVSRKGAEFGPLIKPYQRYMLAVRVNEGIVSDLTGRGEYLYSQSPKYKGLSRWLTVEHMEQRAHVRPLREELGFLEKILTMPTDEAKALIDLETKKLLTKETVDRILRVNPRMLAEFSDLFPPEMMNVLKLREERIKKILLKRNDPAIWRRMPAMLKSRQTDVRELANTLLWETDSWPENMWRALPKLILDPELRDVSFGARLAVIESKLPDGLAHDWIEIFKTLKDPEEIFRMGKAIGGIVRPDSKEKLQFLEIMQDTGLSVDHRKQAVGWVRLLADDPGLKNSINAFLSGPMPGLPKAAVLRQFLLHPNTSETVMNTIGHELRRPLAPAELKSLLDVAEFGLEGGVTAGPELCRGLFARAPHETNAENIRIMHRTAYNALDLPEDFWPEILGHLHDPGSGSSLAIEMVKSNTLTVPEKFLPKLKAELNDIKVKRPDDLAQEALSALDRRAASLNRCAEFFASMERSIR